MLLVHWKRILSILFGFGASILALWFVADSADVSVLLRSGSRIQWQFAPLFVLSVFVAHLINGWRWHLLLHGSISFPWSVAAIAVGTGANQVLPARGGELLRLYMTYQLSGRHDQDQTPGGELAGRMFVEKLLESSLVIGAALVAFSEVAVRFEAATPRRFALLAGATLLGAALTYFVLRRWNSPFIAWLGGIFRKLGAGALFRQSVGPQLAALGAGMSLRSLFWPVLLTLTLWLAAYGMMYRAVAGLVGLDLEYFQILFLVCASAIGLALPSAPSGIGVLHASLVAACLVMGLSAEEGLLFGTAAHALAVLSNGIPAVPLYALFWLRLRSERAKSKNAPHPA